MLNLRITKNKNERIRNYPYPLTFFQLLSLFIKKIVNREAGERMDYPIVDWEKEREEKGNFWWK